MPSFCRHNRLESTCPVCSRKRRQEELASRPAKTSPPRPARKPAAARGTASRSGARRRAGGSEVVVRRLARAADDGYEHDLVPGIRASADAALLAQELAFAAARLDGLRDAPPGPLGEAAALGREGRREEALWLLAQTVAIGPRETWQGPAAAESPDAPGAADQAGTSSGPFTAIAAAVVPWAGDALPDVAAADRGPRGCADPVATLRAYRAWAARSGGQAAGLAGDASWTAQRRFDRAFERLALPGLVRGPRYELLLLAAALGLVDAEPASLHLLADPRDPTLAAAKRVFGFGDPIVLARRASELAAASLLPVAALDLGLLNWARLADDPAAGRITGGVDVVPDADAQAVVLDALGLHPANPAPDLTD